MPVVHELFGEVLTRSGAHGGKFRHAKCPYMDGEKCDGGGNRDMARWPSGDMPLAPYFDRKSVGNDIPCGVCSVFSGRSWAVCPRRLLTFNTRNPSPQQKPLLDRVLGLAGCQSGDKIKVWSEITVSCKVKEKMLKCRLDYVLKPEGRCPVVVEIMTSSTSGGNRAARTDIKNAFCDAVLYAEGGLQERNRSPGVNIRQVWARMASQLIVKSQIANEWGGCAIWVVQDTLMDYIRSNTGLRLDELKSNEWTPGEVNIVSANLDNFDDIKLYKGPVVSRDGEACWVELLNTPVFPGIEVIDEKLPKKDALIDFQMP